MKLLNFLRNLRITMMTTPGVEHVVAWFAVIMQHGDHPGHPFF